MKKTILFIVFVLPLAISGQIIEKGYHGFVEGGYAVNTGGTISINWAEVNTIHGYQVNPNIFVGAGLGIHFTPEFKGNEIGGLPHWRRGNKIEKPIFANFRWTMLNKKVTPLVDLRLGHNLSNGSGMYGSAGLGCRLALKNNKALYFVVSYTSHKLKFEESYLISYRDYYSWRYKEIKQEQTAVSARIGFEF